MNSKVTVLRNNDDDELRGLLDFECTSYNPNKNNTLGIGNPVASPKISKFTINKLDQVYLLFFLFCLPD